MMWGIITGLMRSSVAISLSLVSRVAVAVIPMMCTWGGIKLRTSSRLLNSVLKQSPELNKTNYNLAILK